MTDSITYLKSINSKEKEVRNGAYIYGDGVLHHLGRSIGLCALDGGEMAGPTSQEKD